MNKGTVDTQQRRFQLSRTPNNTFPLTISGRGTQVGIASLSGARVSEGEAKGANRRRTFTQILLLSLSLFADYCWLAFFALLLINANSFLLISAFATHLLNSSRKPFQLAAKFAKVVAAPAPSSVQQKQFSNEAQVQKIDWLNICVDAVDIDKVHSACPINLPVSDPRHRQQSMSAFNKIK